MDVFLALHKTPELTSLFLSFGQWSMGVSLGVNIVLELGLGQAVLFLPYVKSK